jgi:hypothetical protein
MVQRSSNRAGTSDHAADEDDIRETSSAVCRLLLALLAVVVGVIVVNENGGSPAAVVLSCASCSEMVDTIRRYVQNVWHLCACEV